MPSSRLVAILLACLLLKGVAPAADFVGNGEEADPGDAPSVDSKKTERPKTEESKFDPTLPPPVPKASDQTERKADPANDILLPPPEEGDTSGALKPIREYRPPADPRQPVVPGAIGGEAPLKPIAVDLTADLPTAVKPKKKGPFWVVMEDFKIQGPVTPSVKRAFELVADMKKYVYRIAEDLDAGGKEKTRLIFTTESLSKAITETVKIWPRDEDFRDVCRITKSRALVLEEELRGEPRRWSHVRWAFQAVQKEVKNLRKVTVAKASGQAQPIRVVTKDGKEILIEPARGARQVERERQEARLKEMQRQKEKLREEVEGPQGRKPLGTSE